MKICSIEGCGKGGPITRGYCSAHYWKWRQYGDPLGSRRRGPRPRRRWYTDWKPGDPLLHIIPESKGVAFWNLVQCGSPEECWPWRGMKDRHGYGVFKLSATAKITASRLAYILGHGEIGKAHVCHHCDNPPCCNPGHLYLGTPATNAQDKVQRGRWRGPHPRKGSSEPTAPVLPPC